MYKNESANTHIKTFGSPGFSSLTMSYYLSYLILKFVPYIGKDKLGYDEYCKKTFLSTSINHEGALFLNTHCTSILIGKDSEKPIEAVLTCKSGASLLFEFKPDQNNLMDSYLTIKKNNETISFKFPTYQYQVWTPNGGMVTKVAHLDLGVFSKILEGYLAAIAADEQWNKV